MVLWQNFAEENPPASRFEADVHQVFFRKGQVKEVKWAGNPYENFSQGTKGYIEPRKSFRSQSETVVGKCREWMEEQVETAAVLCLVYSKFIKVHSGHPSQHFSLLTNVRSGVKRRRLYKIASL